MCTGLEAGEHRKDKATDEKPSNEPPTILEPEKLAELVNQFASTLRINDPVQGQVIADYSRALFAVASQRWSIAPAYGTPVVTAEL
jgi:hypothetical protein